jgi:hypothetical protein
MRNFITNNATLFYEFAIGVNILGNLNASMQGLSVDFNKPNAQATLFFKLNKLPDAGKCYINNNNNNSNNTYELSSVLEIVCDEWTDKDGFVESYTFFGKNEKILSTIK